MNSSSEALVNSCQFTPVYLVQNPGVLQAANTYVLTVSDDIQSTPNNNLKLFYESSGNIECDPPCGAAGDPCPPPPLALGPRENGAIGPRPPLPLALAPRGNGAIGPRPLPPLALAPRENGAIGNNLKLASILLPKIDYSNQVPLMSNTILNPNIGSSIDNSAASKMVTQQHVECKLVKIKDVPPMKRRTNKTAAKLSPKIKPTVKEPTLPHAKYTSVQLIKLGETYHSVNELSAEQTRLVSAALRLLAERRGEQRSERRDRAPAYDPATNTRYIYKIISPKDLAIVGKKKAVTKEDKKNVMKSMKKVEDPIEEEIEPPEEPEERDQPAQVTRSGRRVRLPRARAAEQRRAMRPKRKPGTTVSCFQCSANFASLYRLQKHYEQQPTHIPSKVHSDLFHCLRAIVRGGAAHQRARVLLQQLHQLLLKLRALLPCLLAGPGPGARRQPACTLPRDLARLFGISPGKYNIDVEALNCVKDKNGHCEHNPPASPPAGPQPLALSGPQDPTPSGPQHPAPSGPQHPAPSGPQHPAPSGLLPPAPAPDFDNCARLHSAAEWPTVSSRTWKRKRPTPPANGKKLKVPAQDEQPEPPCGADGEASGRDDTSPRRDGTDREGTSAALHGSLVHFHSAHFDIRSSPIKSSATVFHKFQIDSSKLAALESPAMRPLKPDAAGAGLLALLRAEPAPAPVLRREPSPAPAPMLRRQPNPAPEPDDSLLALLDEALGEAPAHFPLDLFT